MSNVSLLAGASEVDGMKFLFRQIEHDRMQQEYEHVFDFVQQATALPTATLQRLIKFKCLRGGHAPAGSLYSIFLVGDAARAYLSLPWRLSGALVEMHVKCYLVPRHEDSLEWFNDAVWKAPTVVNLSFVKSKPVKGRPKASGDKGIRIGSRKSDKHAVVYRRQQERPGYEARLRDQELRSAVQKVEMMRLAVKEAGESFDDPTSWRALKAIVSQAGYAYSQKLLRQMGVNLVEYFEGVESAAELDRHGRYAELDYDEELSAIVPIVG